MFCFPTIFSVLTVGDDHRSFTMHTANAGYILEPNECMNTTFKGLRISVKTLSYMNHNMSDLEDTIWSLAYRIPFSHENPKSTH